MKFVWINLLSTICQMRQLYINKLESKLINLEILQLLSRSSTNKVLWKTEILNRLHAVLTLTPPPLLNNAYHRRAVVFDNKNHSTDFSETMPKRKCTTQRFPATPIKHKNSCMYLIYFRKSTKSIYMYIRVQIIFK